MPPRLPRLRALFGAATALVTVVGLYVGPLALVSQVDGDVGGSRVHVVAPPRPAVTWTPPPEDTPDDVPLDDDATAEPSDDAPVAGDAPAPDDDAPLSDDAVPHDVLAAPASDARITAGPARRIASRRAARPARRPGPARRPRPAPDLDTPYISPKGNEKKRCAALVDDVVRTGEREWVVSRELVNCYTTHLHQMDRMAWTAWRDDPDKDRHLGVAVRPSRGPNGEVLRRAGIERGDVLLSVAGVRIRSWSQVAVLAPRLMVNGRVRVRVQRGDEIVALTYRVKGPRGVAKARGEAWEGPGVADAGR